MAAKAVQEFLDEVSAELGVIATWVSGPQRRKVNDLQAKVEAFDGTATTAKKLTEGDSASTA